MWREGETETERTSKLEPAENAGGRGARKDRKGEGGGSTASDTLVQGEIDRDWNIRERLSIHGDDDEFRPKRWPMNSS